MSMSSSPEPESSLISFDESDPTLASSFRFTAMGGPNGQPTWVGEGRLFEGGYYVIHLRDLFPFTSVNSAKVYFYIGIRVIVHYAG